MSRTEVFVDAAFAFAITMLVISIDAIPADFAELVDALKATPAFLVSFVIIMLFWWGHKSWSMRYGLDEDRVCALLSLALVFVVLVYIYPLRVMTSTLFAWLSGGWLTGGFELSGPMELVGVFQIYGVGFFALSLTLSLLYWRAGALAPQIGLDARERALTGLEALIWAILAVTGLASAAWATFMPVRIAVYAGFVYATLFVSTFVASAVYPQPEPDAEPRRGREPRGE